MDTTRADRLGLYGYEAGTSPHLDRFAREASVFTHAVSQAAVTPVSHASIFTGLNPYRHGLRVMHGRSENRLDPGQETLAEILHEAGYATAAFVSAFPVTDYFGLAQGFEVFDDDFAGASPTAEVVGDGGTISTGTVQRHAGETTDRALAWLRGGRGEAAPFFLWLHYFDPHDDKVVPPGDAHEAPPPGGFRDRQALAALYDVEIRYMDSQIGRVFDALRADGLWDDSVVVVTSDHGEGLGDHDWWSHGILYQEQIRVPLLIRAPAVPEPRRIPALVRSVDIAPTVLDLVGIPWKRSPPLDGRSLVDAMQGGGGELQLTAYSDSVNLMRYVLSPEIRETKSEMLFSIILDGRWKYIHKIGSELSGELYDLERDPREGEDLVKRRPDIVGRALAELKRLEYLPYGQLEGMQVPGPVVEELKALGYVTEARPAP
jgi:arylsulfatase A-like enzyme